MTSSPPAAADGPSLGDLLCVPPTVQSPFTPGSLGASAQSWAALLRDGDLVEVRPGFAVLPGTAITMELRALSLAGLVPAGVVVGRASAAWVHAGGAPERRVCVLYSPGGHRPRDLHRLEACQATVRPWEVLTVPLGAHGSPAGSTLAVTTLVRTAMDVATWCAPEQAETILSDLVSAGLDIDEALHRLDLVASWRGAETARTRLLSARRRARSQGPRQS